MWSGSKIVSVSYTHDDYLVSEEKCIEKDKIESKTRRPTVPSLSLWAREVPLQSVFHSTHQPTTDTNIALSLDLSLHILFVKQTPQPSQSSSVLPLHEASSSLSLSLSLIHDYKLINNIYHLPSYIAFSHFHQTSSD